MSTCSTRCRSCGFLDQDSEPVDILRAVRLVAAGESLLSPSVTRRVISSFTARSALRRPHPRLAELTEREVLGPVGEGLSNVEIAERLVSATPRRGPTSAG